LHVSNLIPEELRPRPNLAGFAAEPLAFEYTLEPFEFFRRSFESLLACGSIAASRPIWRR